MKIYTLGTAAAVSPVTGSHHTSVAIETKNGLYFFDVGENCANTARIHGIDITKTVAIFNSHIHIDHIGGLTSLLWNIQRVKRGWGRQDRCEKIEIYTPDKKAAKGFVDALKNVLPDFQYDCENNICKIEEGLIFDNGDIVVSAVKTKHLKEPYQAYSFTITSEGKTIVFSGDFVPSDVTCILPQKCDVFISECSHISLEELAVLLKKENKQVNTTLFIHQSEEVLRNRERTQAKVEHLFGDKAKVCYDGYELEI